MIPLHKIVSYAIYNSEHEILSFRPCPLWLSSPACYGGKWPANLSLAALSKYVPNPVKTFYSALFSGMKHAHRRKQASVRSS